MLRQPLFRPLDGRHPRRLHFLDRIGKRLRRQRFGPLGLVRGEFLRASLRRSPGLFLRRGLFLRPLGNVVYLFLPQAVTREAVDDILDRFAGVLRSALRT